jgi:hypothetical protein
MNIDQRKRAARAAVKAIVEDLSDRRGLRHQWDQIDDETKREIVKTWLGLVVKELEAI